MTLTDIECALNRMPFLPFEIHLENRRILQVPHPELLLISEDKRTALVAEGDLFHVIELERVQLLRFPRSDL